jgi:glyoxylase-like metal-dependent hydrolase (beta-lactamase superfamily II)
VASIEIEPFYDPVTATLTYLVFDRETRDAVVIDPVLDYDPASGKVAFHSVEQPLARIRALGLALHYVLETHVHADHLSGSQTLQRELGAKIAIGERITEIQALFKPVFGLPASFPTDGSQFDRLLHDGELVHAGALAIEVIATPGHTPACVSYHIGDAVFTGDALLLEDTGTGRCDFPRACAATLYHSVHRLYALPPATRVFVGHDYPPACRQLAWATTIERERERNIQLSAATSLDDYVAFRHQRDLGLAAPRLLLPSIQVNIDAGRLPRAESSGRRYLRIPLDVGHHLEDTAAP